LFYLAPKPPQNFRLISHPALSKRTFSWSYPENSIQDSIVIRVCIKESLHTCLVEKKYVGQLPVQHTTEQRLADGEYSAYAYSTSRGVDSGYSNVIYFIAGMKSCNTVTWKFPFIV